MPFFRRLLITSAVVAPTYYVYSTVTRLEAKYPRLQPETASTSAFKSSAIGPYAYFGRHHTPHVDIYGGDVPAKALRGQRDPETGRQLSLEEVWARHFLESPVLRFEGWLFGALFQGPGDCGEQGFYTGQPLLNGGFEVVRAPSHTPSLLSLFRPEPLLVQWVFPPPLVSLCRKAATDWGYPYRFMSGGRHEFGVGDVTRDGTVEVRFGSAHDYEWIDSEGKNQKTIPKWTARLHRAYAMWILDERIEALKKDAVVDA